MKNKEIKEKATKYDKGQVFVKIMAGILALLMVAGTGASLVFALMAQKKNKRNIKEKKIDNKFRNELGKFL